MVWDCGVGASSAPPSCLHNHKVQVQRKFRKAMGSGTGAGTTYQ